MEITNLGTWDVLTWQIASSYRLTRTSGTGSMRPNRTYTSSTVGWREPSKILFATSLHCIGARSVPNLNLTSTPNVPSTTMSGNPCEPGSCSIRSSVTAPSNLSAFTTANSNADASANGLCVATSCNLARTRSSRTRKSSSDRPSLLKRSSLTRNPAAREHLRLGTQYAKLALVELHCRSVVLFRVAWPQT